MSERTALNDCLGVFKDAASGASLLLWVTGRRPIPQAVGRQRDSAVWRLAGTTAVEVGRCHIKIVVVEQGNAQGCLGMERWEACRELIVSQIAAKIHKGGQVQRYVSCFRMSNLTTAT